jgi:hypothetical protein
MYMRSQKSSPWACLNVFDWFSLGERERLYSRDGGYSLTLGREGCTVPEGKEGESQLAGREVGLAVHISHLRLRVYKKVLAKAAIGSTNTDSRFEAILSEGKVVDVNRVPPKINR